MKTPERPKYSIAQNVCFCIRLAWHKRKRVLFVSVLAACISLLLNLVQLYVSPMILEKLEAHASLSQLLVTIGGFTAALFLLRGLDSYVQDARHPAEIDVRVQIIEMLSHKKCVTSYSNVLDPQMIKKMEQAQEVTSNNSSGSEHIWRTLTAILTNLAGFCIYLLLKDLNLFLILTVLVTSVISFFVTRYVNEWEYRHKKRKRPSPRRSAILTSVRGRWNLPRISASSGCIPGCGNCRAKRCVPLQPLSSAGKRHSCGRT